MICRRNLRWVLSVAVAAISYQAQAADLPVKAVPPPTLVQTSSGFYVGAGGSVLLPGTTDVRDNDCTNANSLIPCGASAPLKASSGWGVFAGVGYRFNPWLRADVGIGTGQIKGTGSRAPAPGELFASSYTAKVDVVGIMGTVYLDVAGLLPARTLGYFEPFVGFGGGPVRGSVRELSFTNVGFPGTVFSLPKDDQTRMGWHVVAGTGRRLTDLGLRNWIVDVSWSYTDFGRVSSPAGSVTTNTGVFAPFPTNGFSIRAHGQAVNLALRYEFN